jgi:hypothetical protein
MWIVGYCFVRTYDWEMNRKPGKEVILQDVSHKKKRKKKKLRYLFKRPSIPPNPKENLHQELMKPFDIILEKWKKKIGEKWIQKTATFWIEAIDIALEKWKKKGLLVTSVPEGGQ